MFGVNAHIVSMPFDDHLVMHNPRLQVEEEEEEEEEDEGEDDDDNRRKPLRNYGPKSIQERSPIWARTRKAYTWFTTQAMKLAGKYGLVQPYQHLAKDHGLMECNVALPLIIPHAGLSTNSKKRVLRIPSFQSPRRVALHYEDDNGQTATRIFENEAACFAIIAADINTFFYERTV
jgi:hypothetical protein